MKYHLYDSVGKFIKSFPTYIQASNYKFVFGNYGWSITFKRNNYGNY